MLPLPPQRVVILRAFGRIDLRVEAKSLRRTLPRISDLIERKLAQAANLRRWADRSRQIDFLRAGCWSTRTHEGRELACVGIDLGCDGLNRRQRRKRRSELDGPGFESLRLVRPRENQP